MKKRGFPLFGLLVAIFGGLCINYNIGEGIVEHAAWAADMGLPAPTPSNYVLGQIADVIVNLVVVDTVATPNATSFQIVETETLCTGYERLQQPLGRTDIFPRYDVVHVSGHKRVRCSSRVGNTRFSGMNAQ